MNELTIVFDRMRISTNEVLEAMNTKWNALGFRPRLVGGHCIGIDPYYFVYQAEKLGYHSQIIASGRRVNDGMSEFVAQNVVKQLICAGINVCSANIYLMGMTFKEDCPDMRNSRAVDVYHYLQKYGLNIKAVDPVVNEVELMDEYGISLCKLRDVTEADCLVFLVAHNEFRKLEGNDLNKMFKCGEKKVLLDIKSIFADQNDRDEDLVYWSL